MNIKTPKLLSYSLAPPSESFQYPIPLMDGRVVILNNFPRQLIICDAERICRIIMALADHD